MKRRGHSGRIGKYIVDGILGHGGMGTVYRAIEPETGRFVALKLLNPSEALAEFLDGSTLREIFATEVLAMSRLHHPHIADVLDSDFDNGRPFYTMQYFCDNLGMMIGEKFVVEETSRMIPAEKALAYGSQILAGLDGMHSAGIIHRDIKPFNMMVTSGDAIKICDFGMVKLQNEDSFEPEGINIGSPYYSAPEQISDPTLADERSDLYSAGVLLYRMLTGELPAMKDFMLSHVDQLYDERWDAFFARVLSWNPDQRFQSAQQMSEELFELELHWKKKKRMVCRKLPPDASTAGAIPLRSAPLRASGTKAAETFHVDRLWQPRSSIRNSFKLTDSDTVLDETTLLIWQRIPSDYHLDHRSAEEYIAALNAIQSGGISSWRLPTVNELLSLVVIPALPQGECENNPFISGTDWFWSCDRRSPETSWYVNIKLGYTGWQHDRCLYAVRAVASSPE